MINKPTIIIACVDGSHYTDSVCAHAAWAGRRLQAAIHVLHVLVPRVDQAAATDDSGAIGRGARSTVREKLAQLDEARGKLDQHKGKLILDRAKAQLNASGVTLVEALHQRGALPETLAELEPTAQLIVLGKRGERADLLSQHLGSNFERVARAAHTPVLVCSRTCNEIHRLVVAFDGRTSASKAVDYIALTPLLQGLECHLLIIGPANQESQHMLDLAATSLKQRGFSVQTHIQPGNPDNLIPAYIAANSIDLLVMGAYGHSRSTTSAILQACHVPVLLFHE
jgi:nucleotide-binding universal stress UspA family protein